MAGGSITMPWPAKEVWPNYRQSHHWTSYRKPVKAQRELAHVLAMQARLRFSWDDAGKTIPLTVEITPPDNRRRDRDGMEGACKSILDGLADWLGVNDQYFAPTYVFLPAEKPGRVVVKIGGEA